MSHLLFFDVETTGLSKNLDRVVQIAWILADVHGESLIERSYILKPDNYYIPPQAADIHGISQEIALTKGIAREPVFREYIETAAKSSGIVAHNIDFDVGFVQSECNRLGLPLPFQHKPQQCTMRSTTSFCKIPHANGRNGYKWPKLEELHYKLYNEHFVGAHDALVDVQITKKCYFELKRIGVL
jgi:DNA polymerase-3 subunit epsilon